MATERVVGIDLEAQAGVSEAGARCRNPERSEGSLQVREFSNGH
jgi:hypothetical protein